MQKKKKIPLSLIPSYLHSYYDPYRGVIVYFRVMDGELRRGDKIRFMASGKEYEVDEVGVLSPGQMQADALFAGEVRARDACHVSLLGNGGG